MISAQKSKFDEAQYIISYVQLSLIIIYIEYVYIYMYCRTVLLSISALLLLLGGTWILGLLFVASSNSEALTWIFTIVNSFQVSLLHCIMCVDSVL